MKQSLNTYKKPLSMLVGKFLTKAFFLSVLPSTLIIVLYFTLFHTPASDETKKEIKSLKQQNALLKKENDSIIKSIIYQEKEIAKGEEIILQLSTEKQTLYDNLDSINKKIQNNQKQYDNANRHADNYSSNDIKRYFSNLQ
jgi:septal ring factor EnvC (AmiA/AmiB activator)